MQRSLRCCWHGGIISGQFPNESALVPAVDAFRAKGQAAVAKAIQTVFDNDPLVDAVFRLLVCPRPLAALQGHRIVIDSHHTIVNMYVLAGVNIDRIRARRADGLVGR